MSDPVEKPEVVEASQAAASPVVVRRRTVAQSVRETRDRITSTSGTRPAFDHELLKKYAQTRMSASLFVLALTAVNGILVTLWIAPLYAAIWTGGVLLLHLALVYACKRYLAATLAPASARKWQQRFIALDLIYGCGWAVIFLTPHSNDIITNTLLMFMMLLVVAVSTMVAASLPMAAFAATLPVTAAVAITFGALGSVESYVVAVLALASELYFTVLARRLQATTLTTLEARAEKDALSANWNRKKRSRTKHDTARKPPTLRNRDSSPR